MTATLDAQPAASSEQIVTRRPIARAALSGMLTAALGVAGTALGVTAQFHRFSPVHVGWLIPLTGVQFDLDSLGGLFMATTGAVAVAVGIYLVGYARREHLARFPLAVLPLFVAAMLLLPAAGSVTTFLLTWELMAVASLALVLAEHRRPAARAAGVFYAVMTQLGFAAILLGLVVLSAAGGGTASLRSRRTRPGSRRGRGRRCSC